MNPVSDSEIDKAILAVAVAHWRKVALVISQSKDILSNALPEGEAGLDLIANRIEALIQSGHLLAQGNVKKWRHSEVRKPE